ncbi:MAG: S8 family peptidase [Velocimicrobium sp.]
MNSGCENRVISEDYADFIFENQKIPESLSEIPDFCINNINEVYSVVYAPAAILPNNIIQQYTYSALPSCFGLLETGSLEEAGITRIQRIPSLRLTGQGILIGIIDTGIDYMQEAFKNADGTTKIISIWDQTIPNSSPNPETFYYGTEYVQAQINLALMSKDPLLVVPSTDENGHGTFLAGIAAGRKNETKNISGVVPDAKIVVVKLKQAKRFIRDFFSIPLDADCYQENDIMFGVKYVLSVAKKLNLPISICIGLGSSQGSHDGRHSFSNYISSEADAKGVGVTIAAGNEGPKRHHFSGSVDVSVGYSTVELKVGAKCNGFSMELWGNSPNLFSIDILSPTGEYISRIPARLKETREINFIFENTTIFVDYDIVESQTGDELILVRFRNPTEGIWRFRVYSSINLNPRFNIWLPISNFLGDDTFFINPDPDMTLTEPANSIIPIVATAYNHTNNTLFLNASRGYTRQNLINPTLAAPGVNLLGPIRNNEYAVLSGTSVSAAFVTGAVAMLLEWGISQGNQTGLDTLEMKNILIRGAKRSDDKTYPNREWGYGILDVYNSFSSLRE